MVNRTWNDELPVPKLWTVAWGVAVWVESKVPVGALIRTVPTSPPPAPARTVTRPVRRSLPVPGRC